MKKIDQTLNEICFHKTRSYQANELVIEPLDIVEILVGTNACMFHQAIPTMAGPGALTN